MNNTVSSVERVKLEFPYLTDQTNLAYMIVKTQEFYARRLKRTVDLRRMFILPERLPWASAIPVFDPGDMDNESAIRFLGRQGFDINMDFDVMKCKNSKATGKPTLHLIENSPEPTEWTRPPKGASPSDLIETEESFLGLRGWTLACAAYIYLIKHAILDPTTLTYFPGDALPDASIPGGNGCSHMKDVRFTLSEPNERNRHNGARVVIPVPRRP